MRSHYVVARMLAELLLHRAFTMSSNTMYQNGFGRRGQRLIGEMEGTRIFFSESDTSVPSSAVQLAGVLAHPDWLDESKSVVYSAYRRGGLGIRIEAWSGGRWYQVFMPINSVALLNSRIAEIFEFASRAA